MSTKDNLKQAFAGESQANRRYLAFAEKAQKDGFSQVARLFRAAADAETVHALAHLKAMGGINDTVENLNEAVAGEAEEFKNMYPPFLDEAQNEGDKAAANSFKKALAVEKIHHNLYQQALEAVKGGSDLSQEKIFVCQICGNTVMGSAPDKCPICGAPEKQFNEID